jgi:hypothetical protein
VACASFSRHVLGSRTTITSVTLQACTYSRRTAKPGAFRASFKSPRGRRTLSRTNWPCAYTMRSSPGVYPRIFEFTFIFGLGRKWCLMRTCCSCARNFARKVIFRSDVLSPSPSQSHMYMCTPNLFFPSSLIESFVMALETMTHKHPLSAVRAGNGERRTEQDIRFVHKPGRHLSM